MTEPKSIGGGVALNFPANEEATTSSSLSPPLKAPPRRLRQRLLAEPKTPLSADDIEAKLREANLRRQQFYELQSIKAKLRSRSPRQASSLKEDLAQRLEAKLNAAEQKRLNILTGTQMHPARLNELQQAAKSSAQRHFEKEPDELGVNFDLEGQQAEAKCRLLLKTHKQRRSTKRKQAALLLMQKISKENKYKQCVRVAIYRKHAAAGRKLLRFMAVERMRAHTRVLKAKRQKAEYLRQRRNLNSRLHANSKMIHEQEEDLSRKLARYWRCFVKLRKTTFSLAKAYVSLGINEESVKAMTFEQLALLIKSSTTINTMKALVDRLESRLKFSWAVRGSQPSLANIDHLLRIAVLRNHTGNSSNTTQRGAKTTKSVEEEVQKPITLPRYPVRVVLCAYMILGHPDAVLNGKSECEITLVDSAVRFIREFELLLKIIIDGPIQTSQEEIASAIPSQKTFRFQLEACDKAWCSYLHHFVAWKLRDAKLLEEGLVRAACQLELSLMQSKLSLGDDGSLANDMEAIKKQVMDEQKLLRENLQHLSGDAGLKRMECALSEMRSKFIGDKELKSQLKSSTVQISSLCPPHSLDMSLVPISSETSHLAEGCQGLSDNDIVHSLNGESGSSPKRTIDDHQSLDKLVVSENELLVNEIIHQHHRGLADSLNNTDKDQNSMQEKIKETMEKAFWDCIMESVKQDEPDFSWILKLMKEVRDELCEISPLTCRQDIVNTIDIDILSQMLRSETLDMDYLGKMLEFALVALEKLSAPANDEELKSSHHKLLEELRETYEVGDKSNASISFIMIKGLRYVLQEIQALKREISKARIRLVEPLIKAHAGLEYLKNAFANRYGPPTGALSSLIITRQWLSSILAIAEREWDEHIDSLSALASNIGSSQVLLPTNMRTGGTSSMVTQIGSSATGSDQPECKGERVDKLVRLGLLKLVSVIGGLTPEALPETLKLNLSRLRAVQSQFQKIIVISTSLLILRQILLTEKLVANSLNMENIASECMKQLYELLDSVENVGITEIVVKISGLLKGKGLVSDAEKLHAKEKLMENMLGKSLQAGDPIFERVSRCIYLAVRGVVFGGSGHKGRELAVATLQRVGAALLADRVVEAAEVLIVGATVSCSVHRTWYEKLLDNMQYV